MPGNRCSSSVAGPRRANSSHEAQNCHGAHIKEIHGGLDEVSGQPPDWDEVSPRQGRL